MKNDNRETGFTLTSVNDLVKEPEESDAYIWDRVLPCGGLAICAAKPKVGKSTLARNLAVAVARGSDFFERPTRKGRVVYLCLEEKRSEVASHFRRMGANDSEIYVHTGPMPADGLKALRAVIENTQPVLVIIDPLSRFVRVAEFNSYGEVTRALEPLMDLARGTNCHILALHHKVKAERGSGDGVLGSTGFFGAVDTLIEMKRRDRDRTLSTVQRYGEDVAETIIKLDQETGLITAGGETQTAQIAQYETKIIEAIGDEKLGESDIKARVGGNQLLTAKALRALHTSGKLERLGSGKKGDPYLYTLASEESENVEFCVVDL